MKIRDKMLVIIGIPLVSILIIFGIGLFSFSRIKNTITQMNQLQDDRATMIDADRDAYQAYVEVLGAIEARELEDLNNHLFAFDENAQQAWDRITKPGERFDSSMDEDFSNFKSYFNQWKATGQEIFNISKTTVNDLGLRGRQVSESLSQFQLMRDIIDELTGLVEESLSEDIELDRRLELERAQSLVINGDRDAYQALVAQLEVINTFNADEIKALDESSMENIEQTNSRVNEAAVIIGSEEALGLVANFNNYFSSWRSTSRSIIDITSRNFQNIDKNRTLLESFTTNFDSMRSSINLLGEHQVERVGNYNNDMNSIIFNVTLIYSVLVAVAIILSSIIAIFIATKIINSLKTSIDFTKTISKGDLTVENDIDQDDEIGDLANSLRDMVENLHKVVNDVVRGSHQIAAASSQLAEGNQDLSSRTESQAAALQEISSAIEQMNSAIKANADNTTTANRLSMDVSEKAENGTKSVNQMITSMSEISESSKKIADIIEVINKIAFQTNLLALNASIEAARAGEHGKGFAVVAVEVRKLAKRSDKAAAEIAEIIKNSNSKVDEGVNIANKAGDMLLEINDAVKKVTVLVGEISASSQEQLTSAEEIDKTVSSLDANTQKNAALAEEAASATEELSGQADELNEGMQFFKLKKGDVGSVKYLKGSSKTKGETKKLETPKKVEKPKKVSKPKKDEESYERVEGTISDDEFDQILNEDDFREF